MTEHEDTDGILASIAEGDRDAFQRLMPRVYGELRAIASRYLQGERPDHTLQPTALVHEAYFRLVGQKRVEWQSRAHFLSIAAQSMRRILVDYARARGRKKRGGDPNGHVPFIEVTTIGQSAVDLLDLDAALEELGRDEPRKAKVVELLFFGGMTAKEAAEVLDVSSRTVEMDWRYARTWLYDRLSEERPQLE